MAGGATVPWLTDSHRELQKIPDCAPDPLKIEAYSNHITEDFES
jgi:hypothetical protein